ncbi:retrograde vesicle-mediated transport, Golgi to ER [Trichomonas vaginalis G3]|nr:retrograde vesicle-mediated transport, Golgi to ER [Trichomonas vaginalis G3]KAI5530804.1 retrograde vesicle-mediated transport, Golgi to ER [Trichomonas vaginalis G3]
MSEVSRNPSCKVVILGNSGVGKTSLINRWTTGTWSSTVKPTIGANHQRKTVQLSETHVDVFVWDTAGQEQFQSLTPLYARSAACAIITASITDAMSFEAIQTWIELLKNACEVMPPLVLAVNKIDLLNQSGVKTESEIETEYGSLFSAVFFVSAQSGEAVENAFTFAAQKGYEFMVGNQPIKAQPLEPKKEDKKSCC